ncbi:hypothetical protein GTV15_02095 [Streptomyces sp. SID7803]|nr:hypothetical protein [Streptomyces sp. SID7803]
MAQLRIVQQRDAGGECCLTDVQVVVVEAGGNGREEQRTDLASLDERRVVLGREAEAAHRRLGLVVGGVGHRVQPAEEFGAHRSGGSRGGPFSMGRAVRGSRRIAAT